MRRYPPAKRRRRPERPGRTARDRRSRTAESARQRRPIHRSVYFFDFTVAAVNRFAEQELGLKNENVVKRTLSNVLGADVMQVIEPRMREAITTGRTVEHDFEWQSPERRFVINVRHFALRHANGF